MLPFMTAENMTGFKVNQFCERCNDLLLCDVHNAMIPSGASNVTDRTVRHMASMKATDRFFMECGGEGDCFYHSVMGIAKLFLPALAQRWGSHVKLRKTVCQFLKDNWQRIHFALADVESDNSDDVVTVPIVEMLTARTSSKKRPLQAIVTSFAAAHSKNGVQVEGEIICAFAHFAEVPVIVTHALHAGVAAYSAHILCE